MSSPETTPRFPFGIPASWYQVAYSDEIANGEVQRLHVFGRDLILFRGEEGATGLLDAFCPHMGAHLGHGGQVVGPSLECPFHGWRWNAQGECTHIPYAKRIPAGARAEAYPVQERFGMIFAWFHPRGKEPLFELPDFPEWQSPGWCSSWQRQEIELATHPQEIAENGPDWRHLSKVHAMELGTDQFIFEPDEYMYRWYLGGEVESGESTLDGVNYGLGLSSFRQGGIHQAIVLTTSTPIEVDRLIFRLSLLSQAPEDQLTPQLEYHWAFAEPDFRIWENKIHRTRPLLCEEDGPIARFRSWAAQFY